MSTLSTSRLLLEEYKNNKNSVCLIQKHNKLITRIAKLSRGIYGKRDAWYRWYYGLFLNGEVKDAEKLRAVAEHITLSMHYISYRDCYNQAVVFFLTIAQRFKKLDKKGISFSKYVRMVLGWRMRNWMNKHLKEADIEKTIALGSYLYTDDYNVPDIQPFTMNIAWILYGNKGPLFHSLSGYDRYLFYLYFVECRTIREIAKITVQNKDTVQQNLFRAIGLCRSNMSKEPECETKE